MNTLSSILNWIGSVIGANPNTLTTSSKTIVGAINEVDADGGAINSKLNKVATFLSPSGSAVDLGTSQENKIMPLNLNNGTADGDYIVTDDNKIKIVASGKYLVSAMFGFNEMNASASQTLTSGIMKNESVMDSFGLTHIGSYLGTTYAPRVFTFEANDIICPFARNNSANGGKFAWAYITIQRLT